MRECVDAQNASLRKLSSRPWAPFVAGDAGDGPKRLPDYYLITFYYKMRYLHTMDIGQEREMDDTFTQPHAHSPCCDAGDASPHDRIKREALATFAGNFRATIARDSPLIMLIANRQNTRFRLALQCPINEYYKCINKLVASSAPFKVSAHFLNG